MCLHEDTGSEEVKWKKQTKKNYVTMTEKKTWLKLLVGLSK